MIYLDWFGHLFSDNSLEELYDFAVKGLKLKPEWNHYSRNLPHFDLTTKAKQQQAIKMGAIYLNNSQELREPMGRATEFYKQHSYPKYLSKGLVGQTIYRVDFKAMGFS